MPATRTCNKVPARRRVLNGFGKSVGLVQVEELGVLETPIALTNTFSVPAVADGADPPVRRRESRDAGAACRTVNPLVFECNDGFLNDIQRMAVAREPLPAGLGRGRRQTVGAGLGRRRARHVLLRAEGRHRQRVAPRRRRRRRTPSARWCSPTSGCCRNLAMPASAVGAAARARRRQCTRPEKGSIIMLLATDAPLDARQLRRLALRAGAGLARTGSVFGHGSGDIALAFSTAYTRAAAARARRCRPSRCCTTACSTALFQAAADSTEQAILHALWQRQSVTGRDGHVRPLRSRCAPRTQPSP